MRKKIKITEVQYNRLKKTLSENKFNWDGKYSNEDINEVEEEVTQFGNDIEVTEDCGCSLNQPEPTDIEDAQWFSNVDGDRLTDISEP